MMNRTQWIVITILAVVTIGLLPLIGLYEAPSKPSIVEQQEENEWKVEHVGGMAFDSQNSNVYLTSTARSTANTTTVRCLIRILSFSTENGFASVNHSTFPKSRYVWPYDESFLICPEDPKCLRRHLLQNDFQQVDEMTYPYACSGIYIENDHAVVLGRSELMAHGGSVTVLKLDANKLGEDGMYEFTMRDEPRLAVFDGAEVLYLTSNSHSHPGSIVIYRYSYSNGTWEWDWETNHVISHYGLGIHIASMNVILGGQYLILSGTINRDHDQSSGHFGIYHARDGSIAESVHGTSIVLEETNAQKHIINCVCFDEQQSDDYVAILYRVSTVDVDGKTVSIVNKLRIQMDRSSRSQKLQQTHVWTHEIMHTSMKKCQAANEALVLAGYVHKEDNSAALSITKHSSLNGVALWTSTQSTQEDNTVSHVRLTDIVMDNQNNVLVYGQVSGDDDIVLLQALQSSTGKLLAQTNSPPMNVWKRYSASSSLATGRSFNIVSREELVANYQVPMTILVVGLAVSLLLTIWVIAGCRANAKEQERKTFQKRIMSVFFYLKPFEATDIDLQQSPTGGFNGTYTDGLINKGSETEKESLLNDSESDSEHPPLSSQL